MTAAILWKEYRQQRASWIAATILALVVAEGMLATVGTGSGIADRLLLTVVIAGAAAGYGIISGATLLAGEKEDGTLPFLDGLTHRRGSIWWGKMGAGILLTLTQGLILAAYGAKRGVGNPEVIAIVPALGLLALSWGLLGGALCKHILAATLIAAPLMAVVWALSIPFGSVPLLLAAIEISASLGAAMAAHRLFCRDDRLRVIRVAEHGGRLRPGFLGGWLVLGWLIFRQTRWVLVGLVVGSTLVAGVAYLAPLLIWPIGTLALGMVCGLAVFCPDQRSGRLLWGNQRFPRGRIWRAKILGGLVVLAGVLCGTWFVMITFAWPMALTHGFRLNESADGQWMYTAFSAWIQVWEGANVEKERSLQPGLFLLLWPLYGFCLAVLLGQTARRPVIALVLAMLITPAVVALWLPSFVIGGLPLWQVMVVPLLLLATTRLALRPWISDRLLSARPLIGIGSAIVLMIGWLAGCLWYRVLEVPDVGEPFNVQAYIASLPPEDNEPGKLIRKGLEKLELRIDEAEQKTGALRARNPSHDYVSQFLFTNEENTWSTKDEQELGRWMDNLFEGEWYTDLRRAASLPLGMLRDLRADSQQFQRDVQNLGWLLFFRSLQLEFRGDPKGALELFETGLGVSRQIKNYADSNLYRAGYQLEFSVLRGDLSAWLRHVGADKALLTAAAAILQEHEAASPDPTNAIQAQSLIERKLNPFTLMEKSTLDGTYRVLATQVPWEKERQQRVFRAITLGSMALGQQLALAAPTRRREYGNDLYVVCAEQAGLPTATGPGSELDARQWGMLILQSWPDYLSGYGDIIRLGEAAAINNRAARVALAIRLYHADHGRAPAQIDELVSSYLREVPRDPRTGMPYRYEIEETEEVAIPALAASMTGIASGTGCFYLATALANMSQRFLFDNEATSPPGMGGPAGGEGGMGGASPSPASEARTPAPPPPLPPLIPRVVIIIGGDLGSYPVALPMKR